MSHHITPSQASKPVREQQERSYRAMSAIVWFVVLVACLSLANHVCGWI